MKITTWNVNGFRAVLKKGFKDTFRFLDTDILCLQETKARLDQMSEDDYSIDGYQMIWNAAEKPGYSGVATYVKNGLDFCQLELGIGNEGFDSEGRTIKFETDRFILYNIYFPNGQRGQERVDFKLSFYERLLDICKDYHQQEKQIVITGDFNTAHQEIDLANPKENSKTSGFLPEEREWITKYLENGFKDAFRELFPDRVQYTWWTYRFNARLRNIGWRLDYFLVSDAFLPRVEDIIVHEEIMGSDHCPVTMVIN